MAHASDGAADDQCRCRQSTSPSSRLGGGITGTSTTVITRRGDRARRRARRCRTSCRARPACRSPVCSAASTAPRTVGRHARLRRHRAVQHAGPDQRPPAATISTARLSISRPIPTQSIERIEITRGNSGAVLYGDGAVGGVINIVTKNGVGSPPSARIDGAFGSFNYREGNVRPTRPADRSSASVFGKAIGSDGYRDNNAYTQIQRRRRFPLHGRPTAASISTSPPTISGSACRAAACRSVHRHQPA